MPDRDQVLICRGKELRDDHTLQACNIKNEMFIHLVIRLIGGEC